MTCSICKESQLIKVQSAYPKFVMYKNGKEYFEIEHNNWETEEDVACVCKDKSMVIKSET